MKNKPDSNKAEQEYAYGYDSYVTTKYIGSRTAQTHAAWFLPYLQSGVTLLDCGCASGSITVGLARAVEPGQVTGVDISEIEIERPCNLISNTAESVELANYLSWANGSSKTNRQLLSVR